jgi:hypothetical protein
MAIHSVAIRRQKTMSSMPQPFSEDQDDSAVNEVILGVDTHSDMHVAAVITALGVLVGTAGFPGAADQILGTIAQDAKIENFIPHVLRHTFGTDLQVSGVVSGASFDKIRELVLPATSPFGLDQGRLADPSLHPS